MKISYFTYIIIQTTDSNMSQIEGQTKTENGATAWSTSVLGKEMTQSEEFNELISILASLWSATGQSAATIKIHTEKYMDICIKLQNKYLPNDSEYNDINNFITLMMAFTLHKRSVRHGGGRKDESRASLAVICNKFCSSNYSATVKLLKSYFNQGYWKDAWLILSDTNFNSTTKEIVMNILVEQLKNDRLICTKLEKSTDDEKAKLIKELSNCAKFCPQIKGKKNKKEISKAKDNVQILLPLAKLLFPEFKEDEWYYMNIKGKTDNTKKIPVTEKTAVFYRWRSLLQAYNRFMKEIRKNIPFVEKYMKDGSFHDINPSMLTSVNKLRLDNTFKNKPPRYFNSHNSKIPKQKIEEAKKKYGSANRFESEDRKLCQIRYEKYEEEVKIKQKEKADKLQELKEKMQESNNPEELQKMQEELQKIKDEKVTNFAAGTPIDILKAYGNSFEPNSTYESCITELALGKFADLLDLGILCVSDTSGSMSSTVSGDIQAIDVCTAMTAFFAMHSQYANKFIQFAGKPYVRDVQAALNKKPTFIEFCKYMFDNQINDTSTNFEAVLEILKQIFTGVQAVNLPKYIIFWSDMQFNMCVQVHNQGLTAAQQLKNLFNDLGFSEEDVPTIVFWNLNFHDNRPALASDQGIVMLAGFNPQMLIDLDTIINNSMPESEFKLNQKAIQEEQIKKKQIDTWTTLVQTLISSQATVPFLTEIKDGIGHSFN